MKIRTTATVNERYGLKQETFHVRTTEKRTPFSRNGFGQLPEILIITSYPPRECGIATYSQDLIRALRNKFNRSFNISICALETSIEKHTYVPEVKYVLRTCLPSSFIELAKVIADTESIKMVVVQHEFGLFKDHENDFNELLKAITKQIFVVFHTVLPKPDGQHRRNVEQIADASGQIVVMTKSSKKILVNDYGIAKTKIKVIAHGTHLVPHTDKTALKLKFNLSGKKVLSTFGLLSAGKNIETTLKALPRIIKAHPEVLFLIIGKTHPSVVKEVGEKYRASLETMVSSLKIGDHVQFINSFLPLPELLEYLQLTDVYVFTSNNPNQAVSGTFSYAVSCGCPIVSTPIPHALEVLGKSAGIMIDFENPDQLAQAVTTLLDSDSLRETISLNGLHSIASTAWENSAIAHALLFQKFGMEAMNIRYTVPTFNLDHIKRMTTDFGMIQFSKINTPDLSSGYTLDDNARAMIAMCQYFQLTLNKEVLPYINIYLNFIEHCLQKDGYFLNYVDKDENFTKQNGTVNLADANGRAIWALGYLISMGELLPKDYFHLNRKAEQTLRSGLKGVYKIHSTRAIAFIIKGLYYKSLKYPSTEYVLLIAELANRLVQMYKHETDNDWEWFESYFTYANSILPEAMLCAWLSTGNAIYKEIAKTSFDFLLSKTFQGNTIKVISNKTWLYKEKEQTLPENGGEQPIDIAYTIIALSKFYEVFKVQGYKVKMEASFNWFLGDNHLNQIIYNPCTGGCYDGLEDSYVNLNQGAESTVSYLLARLTIENVVKEHFMEHYQKKYFPEIIEQ